MGTAQGTICLCETPQSRKGVAECGAWQFTNAIDSWTWHGYEGSKAVVEVFADADYVQLECNGSLIGKKKVKNMRCKFSLKYQPGSIKARAMDAGGREIASTTLCSGKAQPETDGDTGAYAGIDLSSNHIYG